MLVFLYLFFTRQPLVIPCPAHTTALLNRGCPSLYSRQPNKKRLASRLSLFALITTGQNGKNQGMAITLTTITSRVKGTPMRTKSMNL